MSRTPVNTPPRTPERRNNFLYNSFLSPAGTPEQNRSSDKAKLLAESARKVASTGSVSRSLEKERGIFDLINGSFMIGEGHAHESPKKFLLDNLELLKANGFDVLFMEHLHPELFKEGEQLLSSDGKLIPTSDLARRLRELDEGHMDIFSVIEGRGTFYNVVEKALQLGIKIVPLEVNLESYRTIKSGSQRMEELNANGLKVITEECENYKKTHGKPLKLAGFIGSAHLHKYYGVEGFCDVLPNITSVLIADVSSDEDELYFISDSVVDIFAAARDAADYKESIAKTLFPTDNVKQTAKESDVIEDHNLSGYKEETSDLPKPDLSAFERPMSPIHASVLIVTSPKKDLKLSAIAPNFVYAESEIISPVKPFDGMDVLDSSMVELEIDDTDISQDISQGIARKRENPTNDSEYNFLSPRKTMPPSKEYFGKVGKPIDSEDNSVGFPDLENTDIRMTREVRKLKLKSKVAENKNSLDTPGSNTGKREENTQTPVATAIGITNDTGRK